MSQKPDISRFYTEEEILQAAIEVLRRRVAHINGMMVGIEMVAMGTKSERALKAKSDLFDNRELFQDALNKVEKEVTDQAVAKQMTDAIAERDAHTEVVEK